MKLNEGEIHPFRVIKRTTIPDQGEFFLLRHASGRRLMLQAEPYVGYGIEPGESIQCRVDRVNCTGRVFLEPIHPCYTEGEVYRFEIHPDSDMAENRLVLLDCLGKRIETSYSGIIPPGLSMLPFRVTQIKLGIPSLEVPIDSRRHPLPSH